MADDSIHIHYLPFLAEIDKRIGRAARIDLQEHYSFLDAWIFHLTPTEALAQALADFEARLEYGQSVQ
jgi:hypothetical protein